ncbi:MAG: hypothetical protein L0Z48_07100 [candidate division Zixibacteria bacterium]|nr:hypothetical protein [candidate division Zixibacteria bacterium]
MPFTNAQLVRKHLIEHSSVGQTVENFPLKLTGTTPVKLPGAPLLANSDKVKGKEDGTPKQKTVLLTLAGVQLQSTDLLPESVVVASDSSLGTVYVEQVDFAVDYPAGKIRRLAGGALTSDSNVAVWYVPFRIYTRNTDYKIDYGKGEVTRLATGVIEDGQTVYVDFKLDPAFLREEIIENAVLEAEAQVVSRIDSAYLDSSDAGLSAGATYLAVSILAHIKSLEAMQAGAPSHQLSRSWAIMSNFYRKRAQEFLAPFARKAGGLKPLKLPGKP